MMLYRETTTLPYDSSLLSLSTITHLVQMAIEIGKITVLCCTKNYTGFYNENILVFYTILGVES